MSSIADRIKILRKGAWPDYNLAIQYILNWSLNTEGTARLFHLSLSLFFPSREPASLLTVRISLAGTGLLVIPQIRFSTLFFSLQRSLSVGTLCSLSVFLCSTFFVYSGTNTAGSCDGGSAEGAFQFAQGGIPEDTCLQYEADDIACTPINSCRNCVGPPGSGTCFAQTNYTSFYGQKRKGEHSQTEPTATPRS